MADAPARRRRRDADENLQALLDAAARVLGEDPGAPLADVAAAAGVDRVTAWRHLGSREHVLELLNDRAVGEVRETLQRLLGERAAAPEDVGQALEALARITSRYRILFVAEQGRELRRARRAALAPLAHAVRRGQQAGALRPDVAPELVATLVASAAQAAAQETASSRKGLKRTAAQARAVVEAGLRTGT